MKSYNSATTAVIACLLLLLIVGTNVANTSHPPNLQTPSDVEIAVHDLEVPYGRSVYLDPHQHLSIGVREGDYCSVMVLPSPFNDILGSLSEKSFPCDFRPGEIKYSHFGARSPSRDYINLQVRYDTSTKTYISPLRLTVQVLFIQRSVITNSYFLTVNEMMGFSEPINENQLGFTYDRENEICRIATLSGTAGLPRYGHLVDDPSKSAMVSCEAFLDAGVRYKHDAETNSPDRDEIPMVVELVDHSGNLINQEYFQIMVKIVNGVENTAPVMNFSSTYLMEVNQFVMTAFTAEMLRASDVESFDGDLIFNVTKALTSDKGKIVSTDDREASIGSFRQQDVWDLKIAYKPPAEDSDAARTISIEFQIVDTEGSVSDPFNFMVVVNPMNTMAPVVTTNTGLLLYQGQSRTIRSDRTLRVSDENNLADVRVQVLHGPRHGYLTITGGDDDKTFTPVDLEDGAVTYQHDGTETYSDNIVFRMTDGDNVVEFLFPIYIASIDTNPPHVDANTILEVNEGETVQMSNWVLNAVDTYYGADDIRYTLMREYSSDGEFILIKFEPTEGEKHQWSLRSDGFYEKTVHGWTQANIDEEELFYRHFGPHSTEVVMDVHGFYVQDGADPPNKSPMNQFVVKVSPIDMQPPSRYPGVSLQMKVREFELTPFNRNIFRFTDQDSNDKNLVFKITSPITELTTGSHPLSDTGKIVMYEQPEEEVASFTQAQVDHLKIAYQPPNTELGMIARMLQFTFSVTDEDGNELPAQTFVIFLSPVDNKPPLVVNKGFVVRENGLAVVTQIVLDATDEDTDDQAISFTLVSEPQHGYLQYNAAQISLAGAFTRGDIQAGRILYKHLGSEVGSDSFGLVVSDGMHKIPILVHITVQPIDDEQPLLAEPIDGTLGLAVESYERGVVTITSEVLRATDTDTNDLMLTFIVTKKPAHGQILVNGDQADQFTQKDITSGHVMYAHTAGEIGPDKSYDSFELTLSDMSDEWTYGGNRVERIELSVTILPVDSEPPVVTMAEQLSVFEGARTTIRRANLDASDKDTFDDDILCVITTQASEGFVENSSPAPGSEQSRAGQPISSFRIADIRAGVINYVQSVHQGSEPTEDRFAFVCQDGVPNLSVPNHFTITIRPVNDEIPRLSNVPFAVDEGGMLALDLTKLNGDDDDVPKDQLFFTITMPPRHGSFYKDTEDRGNVEVTSFTYGDLLEATIIYYKHDDTETTEDDFEVELSDGEHSVRKTIPILVTPVDDETPRLTINNGLEVEINETKTITNDVLKATDLDSDDGSIQYIIRFGPQQGHLLLLVDEEDEERILDVGDSFRQKDIDEGRLSYMHTAQVGIRDLIKFDVTDGFNPLIDRYFYVNVAQMDVLYPRVVNKGVTLKEGGRVTLTTDILSTADMNSNDEQLTFLIGRAPSHGHLESTDHPGLPITIFTQLELAGNKIQYVHTGADEIRMDSFQFEVTDGFNPVYRTFRISISDVDNKKPVVTIGTIRVKEGTAKIVTPFELKVDDRDTDDELLQIRITQIPMHGRLLLDGNKQTRRFTMVDLNENRLSYKHDGSETTSDTFSFVVSDGTHDDFYVFPNTSFVTREPQKMKIEVVSVDNKVPQLLRNRGAPTLSQLPDGRRGFKFTRNVLRAEDSDSDSSTLTFILTSYPNHGQVVNYALDGGVEPVSSFTQGDVDNMFLFYILDDRSNATGDEFMFTIRDSGGNELPGNLFRLNWGCISLESATYGIEEDKKYLHVNLLRRGYLGETSFVTITTHDGTATSGSDFRGKSASQVQFNPGQSKANWKVKILQDGVYERSEIFYITLSEPVMAILEEPRTSIVTITDQEDESTVFIEKKRYELEENEGKFMLPVKRSGDLSQELMVICYTESGTSAGTATTSLGSFKDFISRPEDHNSLIRFSPGESEKFCPVVIIDDSLYEPEEKFYVKLSSPMNGRLGNFSSTDIVLLPDPADEPIFYFDQPTYEVDESVGQLEVRVWRTGTDLTQTASVTVQSRKSDPESAVANDDYVGISDTLEFAPGVKERTLHVSILDDLGNPLLEGPEKFELFMSMPLNAILGMPDVVQVTINDSYSDLPLFQFATSEMEVKEEDGWVVVDVTRNGDISQPATVRCYTRQASAKVMMDFQERPNTDDSIIHFSAGESKAQCRAELVDDTFYEEDEQFRLVLGTPLTNRGVKARLGPRKELLITINDNTDRPIIGFTKTIYDVTEPKDDVEAAVVRVTVTRRGDASKQSIVRVFTKDGNAESGRDYNALSRKLVFDEGVNEQAVEIEVLFDEEREIRESFTVRLEQDQNLVAELDNDRAIIYINQVKILADVTFPSIPAVISLRDYDEMARARDQPSPGYPVICVSPCNPKHTNYDRVSSICESEGLNDTATQFRWLVAAPSGADGVTNPLHEVAQNTFFTNTNMVTLDSIYFKQGSRISCVARAVNNDGEAGLESTSEPVTVSTDEAVCQSRIPGSVGVEPFSAHIRHTGSEDSGHRNLVKITVSMPHVDGMLPVISTRQLSNFEITLSRDGTRVGNHRCSNIINFDEMHTKFGFLTNETRDPNTIGETYRYQYDQGLRGRRTLQFYRNLKHEACMWEFTAYYDMTELVQECGGQIGTDGQVLDMVQSYVSLRVPLYVSYVYHSPVGKGWQHFDQETELRLTFVYDTAILWDQGIGTPPEAELQGYLYPTSMRIREDGRLVVNFRTEARFRGLFVAEHPGTSAKAMVMSSSHSELTMTLSLVRSADTYNNPEQKWTFVSDYAIRDYSGTYTIKLIPCTTPAQVKFSPDLVCNPRDPLSFDMDIRFQQVSDPVSAEFSLNTNFYLLSKKSLYLSDGSMGFAEDSDPAFVEGAEIYGRVAVDPVQNLGNSFDVSIEKVFICSGRDGYVPKYDPEQGEFGCLADSPILRHRYKVLDKEQPDTQDFAAGSIPFKAQLAIDDPEAFELRKQSGTDGFRMVSNPLFTVNVGREWYLHAIYTVHAKDKRIRRNVITHHDFPGRWRRATDDDEDPAPIGEDQGRGTQMMHVNLDRKSSGADFGNSNSIQRGADGSDTGGVEAGANAASSSLWVAILLGVVAVLIISTVAAFLVYRKRRSKSAHHRPDIAYSSATSGVRSTTPTSGGGGGGKHVIVTRGQQGARMNADRDSCNVYTSLDGGSEV